MKKLVCLLSTALLLTGCVNPTSRGQQYQDGEFHGVLTPTTAVKSNSPQDYSKFARQAQQVTENSPSLSGKYKALYQRLNEWVQQSGDPNTLQQFGVQLDQLGGADDHGNVLFTGYFSPIMELSHQPDEKFKYPVYAKPDCSNDCPTRAQIYDGALKGQGLELGYAANMIDPFIMEVQGSGFVHFVDDDSREYFGYAGKNNKAYVSIGKVLIEQGEVARKDMSLKAIKHWVATHNEAEVKTLLEQNPSFVFFTPRAAAPVTGTAGIPLMPMASVAGDAKIFPMGTPILAEVPLVNADGTWSGLHQLRLLIVLDTGGAVKDSHLDLYYGAGPRAGSTAGHYKYYGRVWKLADAPSLAQPARAVAEIKPAQ